MLFGWRKQFRKTLGFTTAAPTPIGLTPVAIAGPEPSEPAVPPTVPASMPRIELSLGAAFVCVFLGPLIRTWRRRL
jgi:hypothetical protein